jgi:hypothetical protein
MAKLRHEINILNQTVTSVNERLETVQLDLTQYNGTVSCYFEILASVSSGTGTVNLRDVSAGTNIATINTITGTTKTLYRSSDFSSSVVGPTREYTVDVSVNESVKAARIIVIQDTGSNPITNAETQIELGNETTTTATVNTAITNPKYWKYTAANWNGTMTATFEATIKAGNTKSGAEATLQVADGTGDGFVNWSDVIGVSTTSLTANRVRTSTAFPISLVNERYYRVALKSGTSKSAASIYNAKIIINQQEGGVLATGTDSTNMLVKGGTAGAAQSFQASAASFQLLNGTGAITGVKLQLKKVGSPTDTINVDLVSSLGGSSLANGTISSSSLTTSYANYTVTFGTPYTPATSTTYYIQLTRSPDTNDTTNYVSWFSNNNTLPTGYSSSRRDSNVWNTLGVPTYFELTGITGITKLEPQYLLANTLFTAGTSLQTALTKWDSTEWDGLTNTYYFQADAANGSTSDVTLEQADGGGTVTSSTLTNIDNSQISSALTMPGNENLDTKATTNAGDVAAARILVAAVVSSGPAANTPSVNDTVTVSEDVRINPSIPLLSESVTVTDVPTIVIPILKTSVNDTPTVTENIQLDVHPLPSVNDAITVTESVSAQVVLNISVNDTITVVDLPGYYPDLVVVQDVPSVAVQVQISVSDTVTVTDVPTIVIPTLLVSVSDTITVIDVPTIRVNALPSVFDTVTVSENLQFEVRSYPSVSDTVSITENTQLDVHPLPSVFDAVSLTDVPTVQVRITPLVFDAITVTDVPTVLIPILVPSVFDAVTITDVPTIEVRVTLSVFDSITVAEDISLVVSGGVTTLSVSVNDAVTVTENLQFEVKSYPSVFDEVTVSENLQFNPVSYISVSDSITVSESVALSITSYPSVSDTVTVAEDVTIRVTSYVSVNDAITVVDVPTLLIPILYLSVNDAVSVTDFISFGGTLGVSVEDSVTVIDVPTVVIPTLKPSVSDAISVTDVPSVEIKVTPSVFDSVSVAENITATLTSYISVSDSVTIVDAPTILLPTLTLSVNDTVSVSENTTFFSSDINISVSDNITVSEFYIVRLWILQNKNSSIWTHVNKNATPSWTNANKNSSIWSNQSK